MTTEVVVSSGDTVSTPSSEETVSAMAASSAVVAAETAIALANAEAALVTADAAAVVQEIRAEVAEEAQDLEWLKSRVASLETMVTEQGASLAQQISTLAASLIQSPPLEPQITEAVVIPAETETPQSESVDVLPEAVQESLVTATQGRAKRRWI